MINLFFPYYTNVILGIYIISLTIPLITIASIFVSKVIAFDMNGCLMISYIISLIFHYVNYLL